MTAILGGIAMQDTPPPTTNRARYTSEEKAGMNAVAAALLYNRIVTGSPRPGVDARLGRLPDYDAVKRDDAYRKCRLLAATMEKALMRLKYTPESDAAARDREIRKAINAAELHHAHRRVLDRLASDDVADVVTYSFTVVTEDLEPDGRGGVTLHSRRERRYFDTEWTARPRGEAEADLRAWLADQRVAYRVGRPLEDREALFFDERGRLREYIRAAFPLAVDELYRLLGESRAESGVVKPELAYTAE